MWATAASTFCALGISSIQKRFGYATAANLGRCLEDWPAIQKIVKSAPETILQEVNQNGPKYLATVALAHAYSGDLKSAEALESSHSPIARLRMIVDLPSPLSPTMSADLPLSLISRSSKRRIFFRTTR